MPDVPVCWLVAGDARVASGWLGSKGRAPGLPFATELRLGQKKNGGGAHPDSPATTSGSTGFHMSVASASRRTRAAVYRSASTACVPKKAGRPEARRRAHLIGVGVWAPRSPPACLIGIGWPGESISGLPPGTYNIEVFWIVGLFPCDPPPGKSERDERAILEKIIYIIINFRMIIVRPWFSGNYIRGRVQYISSHYLGGQASIGSQDRSVGNLRRSPLAGWRKGGVVHHDREEPELVLTVQTLNTGTRQGMTQWPCVKPI